MTLSSSDPVMQGQVSLSAPASSLLGEPLLRTGVKTREEEEWEGDVTE